MRLFERSYLNNVISTKFKMQNLKSFIHASQYVSDKKSPWTQEKIMIDYTTYVKNLPKLVGEYVLKKASLCQPDSLHICDGSEEESKLMINILLSEGAIKRLTKYENCWLVRTDPADVARVESKTFISTPKKETTIPDIDNNIQGTLGNWMSPALMDNELNKRFPGCMKGRVMYVIPFSMGPIGGSISKIGIELTDSPYVVASMRIMTRIGSRVLNTLGESNDFVRSIHSVGVPLPTTKKKSLMVGHVIRKRQ